MPISKCKIITIANPKGGVGKTTTSINLATSLAIANQKVLLIDMDPNAALSSSLGLNPSDIKTGIYEVFLGKFDLIETIYNFHLAKLSIIPSNIVTSERENRFTAMAKNRAILKRKLDDCVSKRKLDFDFVLIDTPPMLNDITMSALYAAHSVLIPLQCSYYALNVVERLLQLINRIKEAGNQRLEIEGILLNFYEKNTKASQRGATEAKKLFDNLVFDTIIPKNTTISFATFEKKPVALVDISATGSAAYLSLAEEILRKK